MLKFKKNSGFQNLKSPEQIQKIDEKNIKSELSPNMLQDISELDSFGEGSKDITEHSKD